MTSDFLFGASKNEPLHTLIAQQSANPDPASAKDILSARNKFPEKLNGFSYFDFRKVDWPAAREKWIAEAKTAATKAKTTDSADTTGLTLGVYPAVNAACTGCVSPLGVHARRSSASDQSPSAWIRTGR